MKLKKIISISIIVAMCLSLFVSNVYADSYNINGTTSYLSDETSKIKNVIENFFGEYEKEFDTEDTTTASYEKYFVSDRSYATEVNIALVDAALYQRVANVQNHYSGEHIKELNKRISFDYSTVDVDDETATAVVLMRKTFNYNICPDVDSDTLDEYSIELKKENGEWKIVIINNFIPDDILFSIESQGIDFSSLSSIKKYKNSIEESVIEYNSDISYSVENPIPMSLSQLSSSTYDASGAVAYANKYALSPNSNYFNNESGGGDCTNFASQVMHEGGGIPEHFGKSGYNNCWFYTSSSNRSTSWAGAQYLYDYMHSSDSKIDYSSSNWSSISNGDLIQVGPTTNIGHSMIVTGVVYSSYGRSDLLVTYRSTKNGHRNNILLSSRGNETRQYIHIIGGK